jgi:hypothetical protein
LAADKATAGSLALGNSVKSRVAEFYNFMNIKPLLEETEDFKGKFNGQEYSFTARTASLTPRFIEALHDRRELPGALSNALTDWDITDGDDGPKIPITRESLRDIPVPFLEAVALTITESWSGDKKKQKASASGSAQAAK